eukprot:TRINITY_DN18710_c0_g1_i2.p1 TRINITY_DN18710_c0_g1~~TRINITY_DN18710_c0_g1_i2.p1  ORF type:complete len:590 (-),score=67.96 TRINITY_DN18710_c0_g1_i2:66-1700(-)
MNDPNGPMYINGKYHLFMQYNPLGKHWGDMHWYHMVSEDCVHWKHLPIALAPTTNYDCGGIFTGSATIVKGTPVLVYSVKCNKYIAVAYPANMSDPDLVKWTKPSWNPVITRPAGDKAGFRDPSTAWLGAGPGGREWRMVAGCPGGTCEFKSEDFKKWNFVGSLHKDPAGRMWECPDFYKVPKTNSYVLKGSVGGGDHWSVGNYTESSDGTKPDYFQPTGDYYVFDGVRQKYDYGKFYASKTFYDSNKDRQILYGWVNYGCPNTDWTGIQTFPRVVSLDPKDPSRLVFQPIPELSVLYKNTTTISNQSIMPSGNITLAPDASGVQRDVTFTIPISGWTDSTTFTVNVMAAAKSNDKVSIKVEVGVPAPVDPLQYMPNYDLPGGDYSINNTFGMHTHPDECQALCLKDSKCLAWTYVAPGVQMPSSRCCLKDTVPHTHAHKGITSGAKYAPKSKPEKNVHWGKVNGNYFEIPAGETAVDIRVLVDRSVVEVFAQQGRFVQTIPHCPKDPTDCDGISIVNTGEQQVTVAEIVSHYVETANVKPPWF